MKTKVCPRCGTHFICNHETISQCQCAAVTIDSSVREFISETYDDCLCVKCLTELIDKYKKITGCK